MPLRKYTIKDLANMDPESVLENSDPYSCGSWGLDRRQRILSYVLTDLLGYDESDSLSKFSVLVLGCGTTRDHEDYYLNDGWRPWFTRLLHQLGVNVVGVDIGHLEGEPFEAYGGVNLLESNSLNMLKGREFDLVFAHQVHNSPCFSHLAETHDPEEAQNLCRLGIDNTASKKILHNSIFPQIYTLTKGGFLTDLGNRGGSIYKDFVFYRRRFLAEDAKDMWV